MDIETRLRRAAPPPSAPNIELHQKVLASIVNELKPPAPSGWGGLLQSFAQYLVRYPIAVLTACWFVWLLNTALDISSTTNLWLGKQVFTIFVWK